MKAAGFVESIRSDFWLRKRFSAKIHAFWLSKNALEGTRRSAHFRRFNFSVQTQLENGSKERLLEIKDIEGNHRK